MAEPTYDQVMQALQAADAAGNVEDARQLAQMAASMTPAKSTQQVEAPAEKMSNTELMFGAGSPIARFLKGAVVDPALAVNQILANTGLFGSDIKQGANKLVTDVEQTVEAGRQRRGSTGFDPIQLAGNVLSPVNKLTGAVSAPLAATQGMIPAVARSAATGATLAALQPVNAPTDQFGEKKMEQMATGAVLGPLVEGGISAIGSLAGLVKGLTPSGRTAYLQQHLNDLAGPERQKVIEALQDAGELVKGSRPTASEVISSVPSAVELMAAQKKLASQQGMAGRFVNREAENQAARVRALQGIAGSEADRAALAVERSAVTGNMRETALDQANMAGPVFTKLEKEISDGFNNLAAAEQTAGMVGMAAKNNLSTATAGKPGWLSAGDIASDAAKRSEAYAQKAQTLRKDVQLKQYQIDSLEQNGFFPLRASDITDRIDSAIKGTTSDMSKQVLQGVKEKLLSKADENGILNSRDVYENVRKTLNQDIAKYLGLSEQYAQGGIPQQAAKTADSVKKFIDASFNKSSEGLWSKYLTSYSDYSNKLNRMEIGDYLTQKLQTPLEKESAGAFAAAVANAAGTIKKSTGIPRYEKLSEILTPQEVGTVNSVLADLNRAAKAKELSGKVGTLGANMQDITKEIPPLLSRTVSIGKAVIEHLQKGDAKKFNNKMAEMLLDPPKLAQFMTSEVPKGKIADLTSSMMKLMDNSTKAAFIQSFTVPTAAQEIGTQRQQ